MMRKLEKRTPALFGAVLLCVPYLCLTGPGYADIKSTGFEAGPLSLSAEAVVETKTKNSVVQAIAEQEEKPDNAASGAVQVSKPVRNENTHGLKTV